jgi:outer membrane receptor for ferrienterochelin and colicins
LPHKLYRIRFVLKLKINTMNKIYYPILLVFLLVANISDAQDHSDANIIGHVVSQGEHIPFVNIFLENTTLGTTTDVTGHYMMVDLPVGDYVLIAKMVGYKIQKKKVKLKAGETLEVKFDLEEEFIMVDDVVITGTKTFKRQTESAVIVSVMDARAIDNVAAQTVSESLNFQPGLRMETDCQTCNYSKYSCAAAH